MKRKEEKSRLMGLWSHHKFTLMPQPEAVKIIKDFLPSVAWYCGAPISFSTVHEVWQQVHGGHCSMRTVQGGGDLYHFSRVSCVDFKFFFTRCLCIYVNLGSIVHVRYHIPHLGRCNFLPRKQVW